MKTLAILAFIFAAAVIAPPLAHAQVACPASCPGSCNPATGACLPSGYTPGTTCNGSAGSCPLGEICSAGQCIFNGSSQTGTTNSGASGGINTSYIQGYASSIGSIINTMLVPLLIAIAFIVFLWGVANAYILHPDSEDKRKEGHQFILWGIIGFVIIFSLWGIVNIFQSTLGLSSGGNVPAPPTLGNITSGGGGSGTGIFGNFFGSPSGSGAGSGGGAGNNPAYGVPTGNYTASGQPIYTGTKAPPGGVMICGANYCTSTQTCVSGGTCVDSSGGSNPTVYSGNVHDGTVPLGGKCTANSDGSSNCAGALICDPATGVCQNDPQLEQGNGSLGSVCTPPGNCDGNYVCDVNSDTCQDPNSPGVSDGGLQSGNSCNGNSNACPTNEFCGQANQCIPGNLGNGQSCVEDRQCISSAGCVGGVCGGNAYNPSATDCYYNSDNCPSNEICGQESSCIPGNLPDGSACMESDQCATSECTSGVCGGNSATQNNTVYGCTDPGATNYDPTATADDGSCTY